MTHRHPADRDAVAGEMIEVVHDPAFRRTDFGAAGKKPGITAIVRLRNEEEFAAAALRSILPFVDEVVVVFNSSTDRTPEIVAHFEREDPHRVKAFHYVPEVFPQGSAEHRSLPLDSVHSLVHYNNYALSKASFQIRFKWDGDMMAIPDAMERVVGRLRRLTPARIAWWSSPWKWGYWWATGVNLWDHQGRICVPMIRAVAGEIPRSGILAGGTMERVQTPWGR